MRAYRPLCFASILLILPLVLLAQSHPTKIENGTLAGTVTDTTENVPITGAYVAVTSRMQSSKANARTDRLGHFVLSLPPGDYQLSIVAHASYPLRQESRSPRAKRRAMIQGCEWIPNTWKKATVHRKTGYELRVYSDSW
jgi:hypothetical protein